MKTFLITTLLLASVLLVFVILGHKTDRSNLVTSEKQDEFSSIPVSNETSDISPHTSAEHVCTNDLIPGISEADGVLKIAGIRFPIHFEDDGLPDDVRREIEVDLEGLNFARNSFEFFPTDRGDSSEKLIHFTGGDIDVPEIVYDGVSLIRVIEGVESIIIASHLSDRYLDAIAFRNQHLEQYESLLATMDRIKRTKPEEVTLNNVDEVLPVRVVSGRFVSDTIAQQKMESVAEIVTLDFVRPSVLQFRSEEFGDELTLISLLHARVPDLDSHYTLGFAWLDDRWHVVLGSPGK